MRILIQNHILAQSNNHQLLVDQMDLIQDKQEISNLDSDQAEILNLDSGKAEILDLDAVTHSP